MHSILLQPYPFKDLSFLFLNVQFVLLLDGRFYLFKKRKKKKGFKYQRHLQQFVLSSIALDYTNVKHKVKHKE